MRILILAPEYRGSGGGIITFYRNLAPALAAAGCEVHIIEGSAAHAAHEPERTHADGVTCEILEQHRLEEWAARFSQYAALPGLRRHLGAAWAMWEQAGFGEAFDVVEACDWGLLFVPPVADATRPVVTQMHGSCGQIALNDPLAGEEAQVVTLRLLERAVLGLALRVQSYSRANAAFWATESARDVDTMYPAWTPISAAPAPQPSDRGLVVGRVQRWKGPQVLCRALELLGPRAPALDWVGRDTPWGARDTSTAAHLQRTFPAIWGSRITHHLPMPREEVARRQAGALFNLVSSTWDVFNFTAIEALASGRPTIVADGAGASELIEHGENGFVYAHADPEALASIIDRIMRDNPDRHQAMGRAGQETVRTACDAASNAAQRIAAYREAIEAFANSPPNPVGGWLGNACRPGAGSDGEGELAFLEHQPLRVLARHVAQRAVRKAMGRR